MPIGYKIITAVLALTGCGGLLFTGEINPLMSLGGIAVLPGYYRFLKGRRHAPAFAVGLFSVLTLFVFLFESYISGDVFLAVAHLTISFQAIKSFDLKEPWDHIQVYFMSLLQLVIASELTYSVVFGFVFILFMILLVTAMVLSHFMKEGKLGNVAIKKPVYIISALTLVLTSLIFIAIPRTSYKFLGKSHTRGIKVTGFSGRVDFGSVGAVKLDPTVIMRIETDADKYGPLYWRGVALDSFDGVTWKNSDTERSRVPRGDGEFAWSAYDRNSAVEQKIYLEPIDSDVVFGLADIAGIRTDSFAVLSDSAKAVYFPRKASRRVQYTVYSLLRDELPGTAQGRYLQLPRGMEKVIGLAVSVASRGRTDGQKAYMIEQHLRENYKYSLSVSNPPGDRSPLEDFLFVSKTGYCEHYATAMTVMLRGIGIPARILTGFYGGEKNLYGGYIIVRQSDAHTWVEAFVGGKWKRFDPTPAVSVKHPSIPELVLDAVKMSWTRYVVGFSASDQLNILRTLSFPFTLPKMYKFRPLFIREAAYVVSGILVLLFGIYLGLKYLRREKYGFVTLQYMELRSMLKKRGIGKAVSTTPGQIRKQIERSATQRLIEEFLMIYEKHRFGNERMSASVRERYSSLLKQIKKMI